MKRWLDFSCALGFDRLCVVWFFHILVVPRANVLRREFSQLIVLGHCCGEEPEMLSTLRFLRRARQAMVQVGQQKNKQWSPFFSIFFTQNQRLHVGALDLRWRRKNPKRRNEKQNFDRAAVVLSFLACFDNRLQVSYLSF